MSSGFLFHDRRDAGRRLAAALAELGLVHPVVLALPRGGVPVGFEVAKVLAAPLDILLVRKIGAPGHEEFGIGAVIDGSHPRCLVDREAARLSGASQGYIEQEVRRQLAEIERRRAAYRSGPTVDVANRPVILVDDGIATGGTVRAALEGLAGSSAASIVLAVPVAPREALQQLRGFCDRLVCLASPEPFLAVGRFYRDFSQTSDAEVVSLLAEARRLDSANAGTAG